MSRGWLSLAVVAVALTGCAQYVPAPPHAERFVADLDARRMDLWRDDGAGTDADLLSAALKQNPQVAEARAQYRTAVAAARTARLSPGLTLTLTAEYADEAPRWGATGAADVPLDFGVRRGARTTAADLQALQAWYDYGEAIWTVRGALATAHAELDAARREIPLALELADARLRRRTLLEVRVRAGEDERGQAILAGAEATAAEQRAAAARGRQDQAVIGLAKALGVGVGDARALRLAGMPDGAVNLMGLSDWRRQAALSRSDILRALADYDMAETALRLEVARQYPEVRLGPAYNYDHGVNKLPFSLSLALPSYDLNRRAIAQAEATRAAAGRTLERTQANALAAVDTAAAALNAAQATLDRVAREEVPAADRMDRNTARAVIAGQADRVDALAANAALTTARLNQIDAERAVQIATIDLEAALHRPFNPRGAKVLREAMTRPDEAQ